MKKFLALLLIGTAITSNAQSQDLTKLASGENVRFNAIYD